MSDDILSQDQIDALLSQGGDDAGEPEPLDDASSGGGTGGPNYDALSEGFELFAQSASSAISTLINKTISFSVVQAAKASKEQIGETLAGPALSINVAYESGLTGTMCLLIDKSTAAYLSDLMMMGDGSAEYTEEHKDAIGEMFNQVCGAFNTALGEAIGESLSNNPLQAVDLDPENPPLDIDSADFVELSMKPDDGDERKLAVLIPEEASRIIMQKMSGSQESDDLGGGAELGADELSDLAGATSDFSEMGVAGGGGGGNGLTGAKADNVEMLLDVELDVCIELGKAELPIKRVLELAPGSIVELDRMAGEPVDLLVNNKVVAKGEVVVVDENFGIRIVSLVSPEERIRSLR